MKNLTIVIFSAFVVCLSCNDNEEMADPTEVTFNYNGQDVTYQVVKQEYIRDANGDTLDTPVEKLWLDRNLGASRAATFFNDSLADGDLFQWGRLDDGHQEKTSDTTHMLSNSITPGHDKYIVSPLGPDDWLLVPNDELWNMETNTNCPCPEGWRVPTSEELAMELYSWSSLNMEGAYDSPLKWVASGNRDNHGTLRYEDIWAFVWSSSLDEYGHPLQLAIISSDAAEIISSPRIFASSVRCIKD